MQEKSIRSQMVSIAAQMYAREYISGIAGNLSARLPDGNLLTTPAGLCKGILTPDQLLVVDLTGQVIHPAQANDANLRPTSELPMHLEVYRQRADVGAVIHAHPMASVALTLLGFDLRAPYIPEALVMLGPVPTTRYAMPSSTEDRDAIAGLIGEHDALLLAHHGSLTVGRDLQEAYFRLETLEHTARTLLLATSSGQPRQLDPQAAAKLLVMRS